MTKNALPAADDRAYRRLIEAVTDVAIYRLDRTGLVESWNPGVRRLKGYEAEDVIGRHFSCFYTAEDRAGGLPQRALAEAAREGSFEGEGWRVRKDGSRFWAHVAIDPIRDESGLVTGFAKVTHDMTKEHERERQIEEINASLEKQVLARTALLRNLTVLQRAILADAAVGIIATDVNGTITLFNPAAERMLGYREAEMVGKKTPDAFQDPVEMAAHAAAISAELGQTITSGFEAAAAKARSGLPDSGEFTLIRKNGTRVPVLLNISALRDDGGDIFGYLGMATDLTERRERERLLAQRTLEAEAASHAKDRFLANMSHEIRSPMNASLGMLQILLGSGLTPQQADYASKVHSATESLLRLLNDILDFSTIEAGTVAVDQRPFSLDALMCDLRSLMAGVAGDKPISLDFSIEPGLRHQVLGDQFRLRQVLLNLIGNAIKFTQAGSVKVAVRQPLEDRRRSAIEFTVEDTGIGIAADQLATIFEDFRQVDASMTRRYGGTGLGLTISQKLVALMGGRIEVESQPGAGSRFSFTLSLPPASEDPAPTLPATAPVSPQALAGLRVLVVEDVALNREVARHLLGAAGADVTAVDGGPRAIALASADKPPFDVVLMDVQMPDMDGLETTRRLRALPSFGQTPIIAITANANAADREACLTAGMVDHVAKPFNIADLSAVILSHATARRPRNALVDADLALRRLAGDRALFLRVGHHLIHESATLLDHLAHAKLHGDPAEGAFLLHKFKSLAGLAGAERLSIVTAGFEAQCRAGCIEIDMPLMRGLLAETSQELKRLIDTMDPPPPETCAAGVPALLRELDDLLRERNMRALEVCAAIERSRDDIADDPFAAVAQAVEALDFATAQRALNAIAEMADAG